MKIFKSAWLEFIFGILIIIVVLLSVKNSVHEIKIDYGKNLAQSSIELGTVSMDEYFEKIKSFDDCTAIITVKDIQGHFTTQAMTDELKTMGFDGTSTLLDGKYHSFIGIWSSGKVIYQKIGEEEDIAHGQFLGNHYIYAESAIGSSGRGDIYIDNIQYAVNNRGFNIVVIDNQADALIDSVAYDVYVSDIPVYRLFDGVVTLIDSTEKE